MILIKFQIKSKERCQFTEKSKRQDFIGQQKDGNPQGCSWGTLNISTVSSASVPLTQQDRNQNRKFKGNGTRIKSDSSRFTRINHRCKNDFKICVNPLNPRHPYSIVVDVCSQIRINTVKFACYPVVRP